VLLDARSGNVAARALTITAILRAIHHVEADAFAAQLHSLVSWANEESCNLRWRAETIRIGQSLDYARGVPHPNINEARDRALIAAFVPSRLDLEGVYRAWMIAKPEAVARKLGERYLAGEDVSLDLPALRHRPNYESAAAGFFNTIGDEATAYLPHNLEVAVWRGTLTAQEAAAALQRYADALAAATRSGALEFTVDELFTRDDPLAEINDKYAAARLFTERGIDAEWLEPAARRIAIGQSHIWWVTSPQVVASVIQGLTRNPDIAARLMGESQAIDRILRRSSLVGPDFATQIGELLVAAATQAADTRAAARLAAEMIEAIGSGDIHPHHEILPYAAIVGGINIDELAYSLAHGVADPTYSPRFQVSRATVRIFIQEVIRSTNGYATLLAATETWIRGIIRPPDVTTLDEYTTWVQNKTDDIGRLLGTIVSADRVVSVDEAAERAGRRAMMLDAMKALSRVGAGFTGPAQVALQATIELVRGRADELLGNDYLRDAHYDNQLLQEAILDELDEALYEVIGGLDLTETSGEPDPGELELEQGAARSLLRGLIAAELLAYSVEEMRPDPD
jgi:hypothetical protein